MARKRIRMALALGGAGMVTALALAGSASASAAEIMVKNQNLLPGQEVCIAAVASNSVAAVGTAQLPGVKFRLIYQNGTVVTSTNGPATMWAPYIYSGGPGWQGGGDYTACAKNNGTQPVLLNYLTLQTT